MANEREIKVGQVWRSSNGCEWYVVYKGEVTCTVREMKFAHGDRVTTVPLKFVHESWKLIKDVPHA